MKAIWNDKVVAESDETVVVEGNHYFPASSVTEEYLEPSDTVYECPWKGTANYYRYYTNPKDAAKEIAGHVAFGNGVQIVE